MIPAMCRSGQHKGQQVALGDHTRPLIDNPAAVITVQLLGRRLHDDLRSLIASVDTHPLLPALARHQVDRRVVIHHSTPPTLPDIRAANPAGIRHPARRYGFRLHPPSAGW